MNQAHATPVATEAGVLFTVTSLEYTRHDCLISTEALAALALHRSGEMDPLAIFHAYEAKICGVARRMAAARVPGSPLRLEARSFR